MMACTCMRRSRWPPTVRSRRCANSRGSVAPGASTRKKAWSRSSPPNARTRRRAGSVSCRPVRWPSCRSTGTGRCGALQGHVSSIVWTLPDLDAARLLAADDATFEAEVTAALGGELGAMRLLSPRAAFPLQRQLAETYARDRVILLGDAAHAVHPLAGQGVNLGLRDVAALREVVRDAARRQAMPVSPVRLARWARTRRSENAVSAHAFDAINRAYSNDAMWPTLLRGHALGIAGRLPPLSRALWRHAAGPSTGARDQLRLVVANTVISSRSWYSCLARMVSGFSGLLLRTVPGTGGSPASASSSATSG